MNSSFPGLRLVAAALTLWCGVTGLPRAGAQPAGALELRSDVTAGAARGRLQLTHTISNAGPVTATNVWVTNQLPTGVSFRGTAIPTRPPLTTLPAPHLRTTPMADGVTFAPPVPLAAPPAVAIAVADLDLDGLLDMVVAHGTNAAGFSFWRNMGGSGILAFPSPMSSPQRDVSVGDFNGDGLPDLVTVADSGHEVTAWFEDGGVPDFTFFPAAILAFPTPVSHAVTCDFDGDRYTDLVVLEPATRQLHLMRSLSEFGLPSFAEVGTLDCPANPVAILVAAREAPFLEADEECDGRPDLYVACDSGGGVVSVFRHRCAAADPLVGYYGPRADYACGPTPRALAVADLDRDGRPDIVVANGTNNTVTLLRASETEGFEPAGAVRVPVPGLPGGNVTAVRLFDLDGDAAPELIIGHEDKPYLMVVPNSRTNEPLSETQFSTGVAIAVPAPFGNIGGGPCGLDPLGRAMMVVGHSDSGGGGVSFSVLNLTQPGAEVAFPLGDVEPGVVIRADLELEVGVSGATNSAIASSQIGSVQNHVPLPTATVCGRLFCVSEGVAHVMPGVSVTVSLGGSWLTASATAQTASNGRFCVPFPFECGKYPAGATITVSTPACPGSPWVFPATILYSSLSLPSLYCSNCAPCQDGALSFTLASGRGAALLPVGAIDPNFIVTQPGFQEWNAYVSPDSSWLANGPTSMWISPLPVAANFISGVYTYRTRFFLPCVKNAEVTGRWSSDDTSAIYLNGQPTGNSLPTGFAFQSWHPLSIASGFVQGWNSLTFYVTNTFHISRTGLRVELSGSSSGDCCGSCLEIFCPPPITVSTCSNCAPARFTARAVNPCCDKTAVTCFPPSGSLFPLGTNIVRCLATDVCGGVQSCSFPVIVTPGRGCCRPPALVVSPQDVNAPLGSTTTLTVAATGTAPLAYQWQRDGTNLPAQTGTNLAFANIQRAQAGRYTVVVSNPCGAVTSLVAQVLVGRPAVPDVAIQVEAATAVRVGSNVAFNITLENIGSAPAAGLVLTGFWATTTAALQSSPAGCVFGFPPGGITMTCNVGALGIGAMTNYTITLTALALGGANGTAAVSGDPNELNLANNTAVLGTASGHPPGIPVPPAAFAATLGMAGSFSLTATGTPALAYFWRHDGMDLGPNGPVLSFTELHSSDAGSYVCIVSNAWGMATSAPVAITFSYPAVPTAAVDGNQTLRVTGSTSVSDLEVRLQAGNPAVLQVTNHGSGVPMTFAVASFNRLVIELGDQNNKLIFNDANGPVSSLLNKTFEVHGGAGSNLVVASSTGINLAQLPALLGTLNAAPNFEALAQGLYDQANTNLLNPSIALVGQLYSNTVLTSQMLLAMAQTNLAAQASNLVAQGQSLSREASNCMNLGVCQFANRAVTESFSCVEFTNCLFMLINSLEALEDTLTNTVDNMPLTGPENQAEAISEQMEALIEAHEEAGEFFELGMDALYDSGADAFYAKVAAGLEGPGDTLGEVAGPNFEALADQFAALAEQLLELQADLVEAQADAMNTQATNLENAANTVALQAAALEQALDTFTAAADPQTGPPPQFLPAAASATGTNAGCDRNVSGPNIFTLSVGGIIIGTPFKDVIVARPNTVLILGLGNDDFIRGNTNFNIIFGGRGNDEIHGEAGVDFLFGGRGHDCIFGDADFDLIFGGEGDDNLHGGTNLDLIIGWTGNDKIFGDDNLDILIGWDDDDTMDGGKGIDVMFGGKGNDTMDGGPGYKITNDIPFVCKFEIGNLMFGGDGDDKMYGSEGLDVIFGQAGADEIYGSNQVDVIFGNAGNDKIYGGDGGAIFYVIPQPGVTNGVRLGGVIFGGPDDDTLEGGKDIDVMFGGRGNDNIRGSYSYDSLDYPPISFDCGVVDLGFDIDIIFGGEGNDRLDGGQDSDVLFGGKGDDILLGNGETNKIAFPEIGLLFGGTNNDIVIGGTNDVLTLAFGGRGDDYIQGSRFGAMNLLFGGQGEDGIDGYGDLITLAFGGPQDDAILGGGFVLDLLFGGPGNDWMHGWFGGIDLMFGNAGDDEMHGGVSVLKLMFGNTDNDTMSSGFGAVGLMFGNRGCDTMTNQALIGLVFGNRDIDALYGSLSLVEIMFGNDDDDSLQGGGAFDILFGNAGNDTLRAAGLLNLVFGNSGNDTLHGSDVLDLLFGNTGNDRINGNGGPDLIFGGKGEDKIDGGTWPDLIFGGQDKDILLGNDGVDLIFGGPGGDYLFGDSDTDLLFGGRGTYSDVIDGGNFKDILFGQKGDDFLDGGGSGTDKDRIWGGQGNDHFTSRATGTRLRGNKGDDKFRLESGGSLHVHGGAGSDTYEAISGSASVKTSASSGTVAPAGYTPVMCAEIHGTIWRDDNANGVRDPGEAGLPNVLVFLDLNSNGVLDANEPRVFTMTDNLATKADESGMYWFTMLAPGTYIVRPIVPPLWKQSYPVANLPHIIAGLGPITVADGRDFGLTPCCVTPASGLVLWLPLDEGGTVAYNRAGGLNGLHYGSPTPAVGLVSSSRCYTNNAQYTQVPSHGLIEIGTGDFTIDAWVRRDPGASANVATIVDKRGTTASGFHGYALFLLNNRLWCQLADGASYDNYDSGMTVPSDSQWHFVAVTVRRTDAAGGRFILDGVSSFFNPTAHAGTLANNAPLLVGQNQPGCLDEVEIFNRALTLRDIGHLTGARAAGKCKVTATLPTYAPVCSNVSSVVVVARICNNGSTTEAFTYAFSGLAVGAGCNIAGPTTFSPASGSVTLGPGACVNLPITITRPVAMVGSFPYTQVACYQMVVTVPGGTVAAAMGKLTRPPNGICVGNSFVLNPGLPVYITPDGLGVNGAAKSINVPVPFRNDGSAPVNFTARFSFAVNDEPAVPALELPVSLAPGASTEITISAGFGELDDPAALYTILIEADLDGDGEYEPLSSFALREVVQSVMRLDWERIEVPGLPPTLRPAVSWSSFGELESAPALPAAPGLPGPWLPLPGQPGSPYVVTPATTNHAEFFRLRQ